MIRSMTGYCSLREKIGEANISLEIKTLNHRGYDVHYHSSRVLAMLEVPIRDLIQKSIQRGRVEIYLRCNGGFFAQEIIRPNTEAARRYLEASQVIANELHMDFDPRVDFILSQNGVLETVEPELDLEQTWEMMKNFVDRAVHSLMEMKINEGKRLKTELEDILSRIQTYNDEVRAMRDSVNEEYREKILSRIGEWKNQLELDPNRVLQEVAFYTDRSDIQEEVSRLQSHIEQFQEILNSNGEEGAYSPVGRRLDFLCQEMFREVNTIGSKSSSIEIVRRVLDLKGAAEQLREQVQNVE
ncbi:MAG: YicC/YloC family endoribonuclease [Candidatus Hinthialibacter sp.]